VRRLLALLAVVALAAGCAPDPPDDLGAGHLVLGTGSTTGVFYQVGGAYADVINTHLPGYEAIVAPTAGSTDNLLRLGQGDVDIALRRAPDTVDPAQAARLCSPASHSSTSWRRRSGSARTSIATIRPPATVNAMTNCGRPRMETTAPAAPLTRAGRTYGESRPDANA
jgi:NMT1-like family